MTAVRQFCPLFAPFYPLYKLRDRASGNEHQRPNIKDRISLIEHQGPEKTAEMTRLHEMKGREREKVNWFDLAGVGIYTVSGPAERLPVPLRIPQTDRREKLE